MIKVPVTIGFDQSQTIGLMEIDETKLPKDPNFVFAIGYRITHLEDIDVDALVYNGRYDLKVLSLTSDSAYAAYLKQAYTNTND